ncbi:MAG: tail fiber domain-containing protein [Ferruginibacter sp.]
MMKRFLLIAKFLLAGATATLAQSVGINSTGSQPNASSILDVSSTTKGLLIPRMTAAQRTAIASPAKGLLVFQDDAVSSFFYYDGSVWAPISGAAAAVAYTAGTGIDITGTVLSAKNTTALWNAGQLQGKDISTTAPLQGQVLLFNVPTNKWVPTTPAAGGGTTYTAGTGIDITNSIVSATNTTAIWNAAQLQGKDISTTSPINGQVMTYSVATNKWVPATPGTANLTGWSTTGNAAIDPATNFIGTTDAQPFIGKANGAQVFRFSPTGTTTLVGFQAGNADPTGAVENHFIGYQAGYNITSGFDNQFEGYQAGYKNTSGYSNQFIGFKAGYFNATGTDNFFVGQLSGYSNVSSNNHFVGSGAGFSNTFGTNNHFSGLKSGEANTTGSTNHFEGNHAGYHNISGNNNHFVGYNAGFNNTTGFNNFFEGYNAGYNNTVASNNYFSGNHAGQANTTGGSNTFTGIGAGSGNTIGDYNIFTGGLAGSANYSGSHNVAIGYAAGQNNVSGNFNVFLGFNAGANETGSNKLYISNSSSSSPLIYGEFDNSILKINGAQEIVTKSFVEALTLTAFGNSKSKMKFQSGANLNNSWVLSAEAGQNGEFNFLKDNDVKIRMLANGNVTVYGFVTDYSDKSLKQNIVPLKNSLQKLMKLGGYTYNWIDKKRSQDEQVGVIAQEVEAQFPQLVSTDKDGIKSVAYGHMVPVLVEAIKEQQTMIDELKKANSKQATTIDDLLKRMEALEKK